MDEHNAALAGGAPVTGPRIGFISSATRPSAHANPNLDAFTQGLRDLGYEPGRNIHIEWRYAAGQNDREPAAL